MRTRPLLAVAFALGALWLAAPVTAATYGFGCITPDAAAECATGAAQLSVVVSDAGGGQVLFQFNNAGAGASSIADVYFDDGSLLAIASIINSPGVSFSQGANPPDLPDGNLASPPFNVTAGFSADSDAPVQPNGVNPGETLGIRFTLQPAKTYLDVLDDIADRGLRIGIHVQGFASGDSASFLNTVPEPGALALLGLAGAALCARRRIE